VISEYRRDVDERCVLMGYYAASSGYLLPTFWDKGSIVSRNVCKELQLLAE